MGGEAVANGDDVSSWEGAQRLINTAVETFGDLHAVVNNAGILRDRMLTNMTEEEWDAVIKVHLKGTFAPSRWAAAYWREQVKAGRELDARIINTTSVSGIYGNPGQTNYGAAKMGIAAFTNIAALELARYGVTVNAVAPVALTRMTEGLGAAPETDEERELRSPRWIAPIVTWLASPESKGVTGRVFEASGRTLAIAEGWHRGPRVGPEEDPAKLGPIVADLLAKARKNAGMDGEDGTWPQPRSYGGLVVPPTGGLVVARSFLAPRAPRRWRFPRRRAPVRGLGALPWRSGRCSRPRTSHCARTRPRTRSRPRTSEIERRSGAGLVVALGASQVVLGRERCAARSGRGRGPDRGRESSGTERRPRSSVGRCRSGVGLVVAGARWAR